MLVSGSLGVMKGNTKVNTIDQPGSLVGEMAILLDDRASATTSILAHAEQGGVFLRSNAEVTTLVAVGLAERLRFVTMYLADLKHHYGDAPGIAMVGDVLTRLACRQGPPSRPGSAREY